MIWINNKDPKYIGIPNINFSLTESDDYREEKFAEQRISRGFDDSETWSLDVTIAKFVLPRLITFKEIHSSHPANLTEHGWNRRLDIMIKAADRYANGDQYQGIGNSAIRRGYALFVKWYDHLWW